MTKLNSLLTIFFVLILAGCDVSAPAVKIPPLPGREPEVITWVSGRQWFPATIGILVNDEVGIYLEANSSANKGYKRVLRLNILEDDRSWTPLDTLNLLNTELPTKVWTEYEQFRDVNNMAASKWSSNTNDRGGLRITSLEEEDGVLYAAGEFFMSPYDFRDRPDIQEINGIFNNIRVFERRMDMTEYFQYVTTLEAAGN